ncbi:MAG: phosphoserine transaminase [Candidatus Puniceispirillaceae bacterium]|nr:phosphoserine transaminase [Candidatus Puniceispirillum sp.]MBL6673686.1 phosphoserine transaminase [Candidatus Puniceispirillum sp.]
MTPPIKPAMRPALPFFSSGPTTKRPGWSPNILSDAVLGRSHRSKAAKSKITETMQLAREILQMPDDYLIGIVPGSDTGAVEIALWSMLGARGVDVLAWESFGKDWVNDIVGQLRLDDVTLHQAPYGQLPDLAAVNFANDVVLTWNGTTSGVKLPDGDWIADDREGLVIADATSACFAMQLPWTKLDVVTFSFQKAIGGEGAHGVMILSPRAVERLNLYTPPWPIPKLFRLTKNGAFNASIFNGNTINTPSMLVIEDALDALLWAQSIGGLPALIDRSEACLAAIRRWVDASSIFGFLAEHPATISNTSVTLSIIDPWFVALDAAQKAGFAAALAARLDAEGVGYDLGSYRDAPAGLRIWAGPMVDASDVEALLPWIDWAYAAQRAEMG